MTKVALDLKEVEVSHDALLCDEVWMTEKAEMERMAAEGYVMSFWDCTMQISRKFPDHGANFEQLDPAEDSPKDEEGGGENGEDSGNEATAMSILSANV